MATYEKGKLYDLSITDLHPDPNQPRKYMDPTALEELTASIKQHGVLEPILFRQDTDGAFYVVAGERRFAAAQNAGMATIPAIFIEGNYAEISLVENLLRQDLTAVEEAEALKGLMDGQSYTQEQLAGIIGKATSTISEILSLNKLPQAVRDECRIDPAISKNILIEIAKSKQQRGMLSLYNKYKAQKLSKEQIKTEARRDRKTKTEQTVNILGAMQTKISAIIFDDLTTEDRDKVIAALETLKLTIEEKLSGETQPVPKPGI